MYSERTKTIRNPFIPCAKKEDTNISSKQNEGRHSKAKRCKNHQNNLSYNFYIPRDSRKFLFSATFFAVTLPHVSPVSRGFKDARRSNRNTSEHITYQNPTNKNRMETLGNPYHFFGVTGMKWKKSSEKNT